MILFKQLFLGFVVSMLFVGLTCKQNVPTKAVGIYEAVGEHGIQQLEMTEKGRFIYEKFLPKSPFLYQCDTTYKWRKGNQGSYVLMFKTFELPVEIQKNNQVVIIAEKEQILSQIKSSYLTEQINGKWRLVAIDDEKFTTQKEVTILIEADNVSCFLGCNKGRGKWLVVGSMGRVDDLIVTRMACTDMLVEQQVVNTFKRFIVTCDSADTLRLSGAHRLKLIRL